MSQILVTGEAKIRDIQGPVVANSGVITALDGAASQYVRGDGTLADFPTTTGGGSSVSYYLNGSVNQGTIGGVAYKELSKDPILGVGTDFTISANGYVASFITDANDPDSIIVPGGNWNTEIYFSVDSNSNNPYFYVEVYKYDGSTFTLLGSNQTTPEYITAGTTITPYYGAVAIPTTNTAITDRIAIRIYVVPDGRTVTLHTENSHLGQIVTTFSKGLTSLNNLTDQSQYLTTGTSGTDFNIVSSGDTHTFNIPSASATNRGLVTIGSQSFEGIKTFNDAIKGEEGVLLKNGVISSSNGYTALNAFENTLIITSLISGTPYSNSLEFTPSTSNTYTFPDATGTIALTSDLSSYVPYTGANANVNLGVYELLAQNAFLNGVSGVNGGNLFLKQDVDFGQSAGYTTLYSTGKNLGFVSYVGSFTYNALFSLNSLTNNSTRTYNLPDLSGTLALTSDLSSYVPYTGATGSVNLGLNNLTANNVFGETSLNVKILPSGSVFSTGYSVLSSLAGKFTMAQEATAGNLKAFTFDFSAWATNTSRTYTLPDITGTLALLEGTQTFTGDKLFNGSVDFNNSVNINSGLFIRNNVIGSTLYTSFTITKASSTQTLSYLFSTGFASNLLFNDAANYSYTFPAASGTLALTSDIPSLTGYVPYTGATTNVDLGVRNLSSFGINVNGDGTGGGALNLKNYNSISHAGVGYTSIFAQSSDRVVFNLNDALGTKYVAFLFGNLGWNSQRYYGLPNADGTLALTSDLSAYLPLTGGTLTGALSGTSATFSGNLTIQKTAPNILMKGGYAQDLAFFLNNEPSVYIVDDATATKGIKINISTGAFTQMGSGAATFSSSVNVVGTLIAGNASNVGKVEIGSVGSSSTAQASAYLRIGDEGAARFWLQQLNSSYDFTIRHFNSGWSSPLLTITSGGNVGIGTSTIVANDGTSRTFQMGTRLAIQNVVGTQFLLSSNLYYDGAWKYMVAGKGQAIRGTGESGTIQFSLSPTGTAGGSVTNMDGSDVKMIILESGNVGIGTSSPDALLEVENASNPSIFVTNTGAATLRIQAATGVGYIGTKTADALDFITGDAPRMRITSGGNVLINRSSLSGDAGGALFQLSQSNANWIHYVENTASSGAVYGSYINFKNQAPNNTASFFTYFGDSSTARFYVYANGGIANYQANNSNLSDERTKKDIIPLESYWDKFKAIEIVKFKYKDQTHDDFNIGVIAQQVESVAPEFINVDGWGKTPEDGIPLKSVYTADLHHATIKVLQEAMAKIETLEERIKQLENK